MGMMCDEADEGVDRELCARPVSCQAGAHSLMHRMLQADLLQSSSYKHHVHITQLISDFCIKFPQMLAFSLPSLLG